MSVVSRSQAPANQADLVSRALDVLLCFSAERREWGVTELASVLGMTKSRVHRILKTLEHKGFLHQDARSRRYRLGLRLFELGALAVQDANRRGVLRPVLSRLATELEATIVVRLRDGDDIVLVECIESPGPIRIILPLGSRYPIYYGSAGLAICAALREEELDSVLPDGSLLRFAPGSFETICELRHAISEARRAGYAFSDERVQPGVCSVGVAVRNADGVVIGGLAAGFAKAVLSQSECARIGGLLATAAAEVEQLFGALEAMGVDIEAQAGARRRMPERAGSAD